MHPIVLALGPIIVHSSNLLFVLAWLVFSFVFWKMLREEGILEERIFDMTFYATIIGVVASRLGFVFLFPDLFAPSLLLIGAFWVQPGLWLIAGVYGLFITLFVLSRKFHLRFATVFDAVCMAILFSLVPATIGTFLSGSEVGRVAHLPWALAVPGYTGLRHPVALYECTAILLAGLVAIILYQKSQKNKWPAGFLGANILALISLALFTLEFFKEGRIYLYGVTVNQWMYMLLFAEGIGASIIKGQIITKIRNKLGGIRERSKSKQTQSNTEKAPSRVNDSSDSLK
jgi:prolipoprotein diacylglyceryltransferase